MPIVLFASCRSLYIIVRGSKFAAYPCLKLSYNVHGTPLSFRAQEKRGALGVVVHRHPHNLKLPLISDEVCCTSTVVVVSLLLLLVVDCSSCCGLLSLIKREP